MTVTLFFVRDRRERAVCWSWASRMLRHNGGSRAPKQSVDSWPEFLDAMKP